MNSRYLDNAVERIEQIALNSDSYIYLVVDDLGVLIDKGGELTSLATPDWTIGHSILDTAMFLLGYLPMTTDYECILSYQLSDGCIIDIHLFNDEDCILVILVERTKELEEEARVRQKSNELKLKRRYNNI